MSPGRAAGRHSRKPEGATAEGSRRTDASRPATERDGAELQELARRYAADALKELHRLARDAESEAVRLRAIQELLDRAYGKSAQTACGPDEAAIPVVLLGV